MATTKSNVQVRVDESLKSEADRILDNMGLDTPTAIRIFLKKIVATRSMPFSLVEEPYYTFTAEEETEILQADKASSDAKNTVVVTTSTEETQTFLDSLKK